MSLYERGCRRRCRECGCTDDAACIAANGAPCVWVAADLCSACVWEDEGEFFEQLVDEPPGDGFALDASSGLWLPGGAR